MVVLFTSSLLATRSSIIGRNCHNCYTQGYLNAIAVVIFLSRLLFVHYKPKVSGTRISDILVSLLQNEDIFGWSCTVSLSAAELRGKKALMVCYRENHLALTLYAIIVELLRYILFFDSRMKSIAKN